MSRHFQNDYIYGKEQEAQILPLLKEYFNDDINQNIKQYAQYDFYNNQYNFELKSRKNLSTTYPTTMITKNKLKDNNKELILLFNYIDGLYYIKYNEEDFNKFESKLFKRFGVTAEPLEHVYIPIEKLTLIKKYL
jgi:hypothetical protein